MEERTRLCHTLRTPRGGLWPAAAAFCMLVVCGAGDLRQQAGTVQELQSLVRTLHELKLREREEGDAWEREKHELQLLVALRKETLARVEAEGTRLREAVRNLTEVVKKKEKEREDLTRASQGIETLLAGTGTQVKTLLSRRPLLRPARSDRRLAEMEKAAGSLSEKTSFFLDFLAHLLRGALQMHLSKEAVDLGEGERRVGYVLRLGAAGAFFLSLDATRAAVALPGGGKLLWRELPPEDRGAVEQAVRIAKEEEPARLLLLPFYLKREAEGGSP